MKYIIFVIIALATTQLIADALPPAWSLESAGYINCSYESTFYKTWDCGESYYQQFKCSKASNPTEKKVKVLAVGKIASDVAGSCSPTPIFNQFIEQQ